MVAIVTASFVCTYSEQLLPLGFWWQGYYGGNPEGKKQQSQGAGFKSFPRYATHGLNKRAETEDNSQGTRK